MNYYSNKGVGAMFYSSLNIIFLIGIVQESFSEDDIVNFEDFLVPKWKWH